MRHADRVTLRVAIADDSALFRDGLRGLLEEAGIVVTAVAPDGDALVKTVSVDPPDAVILDIRMPPTFTDEGLSTAAMVREQHPQVAILALSTYAETSFAVRLLKLGSRGLGYLLKDRVDSVATLSDALRRLTDGGSVVDPEIIERLILHQRSRSVLARLTPREMEVLQLMAEGHSNAGIGRRCFLSVKTVETNIAAIFLKLDLRATGDDNRRVLAVLALLRHPVL